MSVLNMSAFMADNALKLIERITFQKNISDNDEWLNIVRTICKGIKCIIVCDIYIGYADSEGLSTLRQ